MPAVAVTVLDGSDVIWSGRLVRVDESDKLKDILRKIVPEEDVQRLEKVQSAVSDSSARYDADGDDEVGVHLEFGRRYVYFRLGMRRRQREPVFQPSHPKRSVGDVLMTAASQLRLPEMPQSGAGGTTTALDRLMGDIISYLGRSGLAFPDGLCDSDGMYIVRSLGKALWIIDGHHHTLAEASRHHASLPEIPAAFSSFQNYNDHKTKKQKKPSLCRRSLHDHAQLLFGMLNKPVLQSSKWESFRKDVEDLAEAMEQYSNILNKAAEDAMARQSLSHVVRPLSQFSNIEVRGADSGIRVPSKEESQLQSILHQAGEWKPVHYSDSAVFGEAVTPRRRYRFLQSFQMSYPVAVYRYSVGGSVGTIVLLWKLPLGISVSDCTSRCNSVVEDLKPQIPQYHTRQMRRTFADQCSNVTRITPSVRRYMYSFLSGDNSSSTNTVTRDVDYRMRLVVLGELPEVGADLRHMCTGRPNRYDTFLGILQELVRDVTAEDERRHGIAHMSHFISQRDLHKAAADKCPPETPIPSLDWLALQFQPLSQQARSSVKYTGKLDVRYCLQSRQLRAERA